MEGMLACFCSVGLFCALSTRCWFICFHVSQRPLPLMVLKIHSMAV